MKSTDINLRQTESHAGSLYENAKDTISSTYSDTKSKVNDFASSVGDTAVDLYASGKDKVEHLQSYVEETAAHLASYIRRRPLLSILVAAGVGSLYTIISRSRNK